MTFYGIYAKFHKAEYEILERNIGIFWEPGMYQGYVIFVINTGGSAKRDFLENYHLSDTYGCVHFFYEVYNRLSFVNSGFFDLRIEKC